MPTIGAHCHELRIPDREHSWRIIYHLAEDAIVILVVFSKKTQTTPHTVIEMAKKRLAAFTKATATTERK
jgi:phage-related protein